VPQARHDQLTDGPHLRILAVVDDFTREYLALVVAPSLSGLRVEREVDAIIAERGKPAACVCDNGTELNSAAILPWSQQSPVTTRARQTAAERLHRKLQRRLCNEFLNETLFSLLVRTRTLPVQW